MDEDISEDRPVMCADGFHEHWSRDEMERCGACRRDVWESDIDRDDER